MLDSHQPPSELVIKTRIHCGKVTCGNHWRETLIHTGEALHSERRGRIATAQYFVETTACAV